MSLIDGGPPAIMVSTTAAAGVELGILEDAEELVFFGRRQVVNRELAQVSHRLKVAQDFSDRDW